ncbi:hypothetical protein GCM10028799_23090 [Kribbella italica]
MLPVLDRDVERVPPGVQVLDDRLQPPVPVLVHHVAAVALGEQLRIEPRISRYVARPGADPDLRRTDLIGSDQVSSTVTIR